MAQVASKQKLGARMLPNTRTSSPRRRKPSQSQEPHVDPPAGTFAICFGPIEPPSSQSLQVWLSAQKSCKTELEFKYN